MVYLIALLGSLLFGAADQYLGSVSTLGAWAVAVSGMSAPWLALPFAAGLAQRGPRRAATIGWLVTGAALAGYFAMMLSPIEGVRWSQLSLAAEFRSQLHVILPGLITGPFFGLCGHVWRTRRAAGVAALIAGAFVLEPFARWMAGALEPAPIVWTGEIACGLVLAVAFARAGRATAFGRPAG